MADFKLAHLAHTSQLLKSQLKNLYKLMGKAWVDMGIAHSDLQELIEMHGEWEKQKVLNQNQQDE